VSKGRFGACFDLKASFYQVPLPVSVRRQFCFIDTEGTVFQLKRVPMGLCVAPEIMQIISGVLAGSREYVLPFFSHFLRIPPCIHIDNIRVVGEQCEILNFANAMYKRAAEIGASFNEEKSNLPAQQYIFCGVEYNHKCGTVCVKQAKIEKVREAAGRMREMTLKEFEQLFGRILFCSEVLAAPVFSFYFAVKWWRRRLACLCRGIGSWNDQVQIPDSVFWELKKWVLFLLQNTPRFPAERNGSGFALFTDATLLGFGGVLVSKDTGRVWSFGGRWAKMPTKICDAEMGAVIEGVERFSGILSGQRVSLLVDNTSVLGVLQKERSSSVVLSVLFGVYKDILKKRGVVVVSIEWIASHLNPADPPSRGREACPMSARARGQERML
jgi:hypothetical protein